MVNFIGVMAGGISISIAVYLQMVVGRDCKPKWIMLYLAVGVALLLINSDPYLASRAAILSLEGIAYVGIAVVEIYGAFKVYKHSNTDEDLLGWSEGTGE